MLVSAAESRSTQILSIEKIEGNLRLPLSDTLAIEEPLEIRLDWMSKGKRQQKSISITMRTPGHDFDLAIGFLFTEGIVRSADEILDVSHCGPDLPHLGHSNVVKVKLAGTTAVNLALLERHFYTSSSCGVCGKASIEALKTQSIYPPPSPDDWTIDSKVIHDLPDRLRAHQEIFESTGGLHASAIFTRSGELISLREDVGRHNALDKVIGKAFLAAELPLHQSILMVSGRVSFELVQKASMAGIPVLAAVGAPSTLAVDLANAAQMTLLGFVRNKRYNIYSHSARIR